MLERLHKHLAQLQRDGTISGWYDREIHAGSRIDNEVERELANADIFLACASPDYIASNYCYERELTTALEREERGEIVIVPVILEPCEWLSTPLQKFKAVPKDGKAVSEYTNQNVAFLNVATELRRMATTLGTSAETGAAATGFPDPREPDRSRYRIKRDHDELHKRDFIEDSFKEIFKFFEVSVAEISEIPEIEARLSPLREDYFFCTIINRGLKRAFETLHVRKGRGWSAIDILYGEKNSPNTSNGGFSVEADEYKLSLKPTLFNFGAERERLNSREAAQMLWDDLLSKVGVDYA
jgi:hypothetical protein